MKIIPLIAAVSLLTVTATANQSVTYRYMWFEPAGAHGASENPNVDGVAIVRFNSSSGWTRGQIVVQGLQPNRTYGVKLGEGYVQPYAIQTKSNGSGNYTIEFPTMPHPIDPAILIFIFDGNEEEIWDVSHDELRAVGVPL